MKLFTVLVVTASLFSIVVTSSDGVIAVNNSTEKSSLKLETGINAAELHTTTTTESVKSVIPTLNSDLKKNNNLHRIPVYQNRNSAVPLINKLESQIDSHENYHHNTASKDLSHSDHTEKNGLEKLEDGTKLKLNELHQIPVYDDRNTQINTINKLESDKVENNGSSPIELPISSRCPQIVSSSLDVSHLVENKAKQRGCRFFIMHELANRNKISPETEQLTWNERLDQILEECFKTCSLAYDNGTSLNNACADGCSKTATVTKNVVELANDGLEREDESGQPAIHRSVSIIIPIQPIEPSMDSSSNDDISSEQLPSMMPNAIKMMFQMMHQMAERARQSMLDSNDSEMSFQPSDNSISISRSMSVLMTKDKDGHSKMVVLHSLPNVHIRRFQMGPNGLLGEDQASRHYPEMIESRRHLSNPNLYEADDSDILDNDGFRLKLSGHLSNARNNFQRDGQNLQEETVIPTYYYRTRLCYYLPRLFYLTLTILVLYLVFWLCCAVPAAVFSRSQRNLPAVPTIATLSNGGTRSKYFFTKNQKYFQLNNKRNSTTSLPPPYPGVEENGSCAEPLSEKQPIPSGGIEIKLSSDKN
ncbi:hypothetical protein RDWZM_004178 [Blomia tropicalis]|uniref:Uncharacterized protein n=1 Tax=Blomia tropicalis TaxID=40697 RepID=A0A9Q0MGL0_BLOTA|nr:hypothetical protein RDWZM_004178 [Blomia tropicalis]